MVNKRVALSLAVKQRILKFVADPPIDKNFTTYCDLHEDWFGAEGSDFRRKVNKFRNDVNRRIRAEPNKFAAFLADHHLDSKGNIVQRGSNSSSSSEEEEIKSSSSSSSDEEQFERPPASAHRPPPTSARNMSRTSGFNRRGSDASPTGKVHESDGEYDFVYTDIEEAHLPKGRKFFVLYYWLLRLAVLTLAVS